MQIANPHARDSIVMLRGTLGGRFISLPAMLALLRQEMQRALDRFRLRAR